MDLDGNRICAGVINAIGPDTCVVFTPKGCFQTNNTLEYEAKLIAQATRANRLRIGCVQGKKLFKLFKGELSNPLLEFTLDTTEVDVLITWSKAHMLRAYQKGKPRSVIRGIDNLPEDSIHHILSELCKYKYVRDFMEFNQKEVEGVLFSYERGIDVPYRKSEEDRQIKEGKWFHRENSENWENEVLRSFGSNSNELIHVKVKNNSNHILYYSFLNINPDGTLNYDFIVEGKVKPGDCIDKFLGSLVPDEYYKFVFCNKEFSSKSLKIEAEPAQERGGALYTMYELKLVKDEENH
jgi:hypothetical protein